MTEIEIRQLQEDDLGSGFLESLDSLRKTSDMSQEKAKEVFNKIEKNSNHVILVAVLDNRVVGSTTLLIEPKFIHDGGLVGHIEDVVVSRDNQNQGIGKKLILAALEFAKKAGCYKTILDCTDDVKPFYEKIGFKVHSKSMRYDNI